MALITEAGADNADSYVTLEFANANITVAAWVALTDAQKEAHLKKATIEIDTFRFFGEKYYSTQALQLPREKHLDDDGDLYIPLDAQYAVIEQVQGNLDTLMQKRAELQAQGVKSYSIDDISETFGDKVGGGMDLIVSAKAKAYMRGLISRIGVITR